MNAKSIISLILFVIAVPLSVFLFLKYSNKNIVDNRPISKNILYLTQPVTSFSGVVDKVDGNQITISQQAVVASPIAPPVALPPTAPATPSSPLPTPAPITLTYVVTVADTTQISQPSFPVNYLFKTTSLTPPQSQSLLKLEDIKVGQLIMVNSSVDLRTLSDNTFEATMITLPQKMTTLNGKITGVSSNAITIKAFAPTPAPALPNPASIPTAPIATEEKEYTIDFTGDTEISRMVMGTSPKPEQLTISDLKTDMQVTVYTDIDVTTGTQFTALRIEVAQSAPLAAPVSLPPTAPTETPVAPSTP